MAQSSRDVIKAAIYPAYTTLLNLLEVETRLKVQGLIKLRYWMDLDNPRTFSEKVNRRKLSGDHELYAKLSDKILVKKHVASVVGDAFVTPTLWEGTVLPSKYPGWPTPFVIKANYGSGRNHFVRSDADLDWDRITRLCGSWAGGSWFKHLHEPWYDMIDRRLLVEPVFAHDPEDYKFFVFHGRVELIEIDTDRSFAHKRTLFDRDWNKLPVRLGYPLDTREFAAPTHLAEMIKLAETLSAGFDFIRVDLYDLPEGPRFGELTFSPDAGLSPIYPASFDRVLGQLW